MRLLRALFLWIFSLHVYECGNLPNIFNQYRLPPDIRPSMGNLVNVDPTCDCGVLSEDIGNRIVGGTVSAPHSRPWMVNILYKGRMHCGGTLINDRYVITAGHCLNWAHKSDLMVIAGVHDKDELNEGTEQVLAIDYVQVHELFSSDFLHDTDDIGLIRLAVPVRFSPFISPICLSGRGIDYTNYHGLVSGWGRTQETGSSSRYLKEAKVTILPQQKCKNTTIGDHIMDTMLCAYEDQTDACQGDSGGPLVVRNPVTNRMEQVGIVSWGIGCAAPNMPGVYTRISKYLDWIFFNTRDAIYCKRN